MYMIYIYEESEGIWVEYDGWYDYETAQARCSTYRWDSPNRFFKIERSWY